MLISALLLLCLDQPNVSPIATGVYGRLTSDCVAMGGDGSIYVLDDQRITRYAADGRRMLRFGGKGRGPGEFQYASELFVDGNRLFVWDLMEGTISIFDHEGGFIRRLKPEHRGIDIVRVSDGWVYGNWKSAVDSLPDQKVSLFLTDESMAGPREIALTTGNGYGATFIAEGTKSIYTPVRPMARLGASRDMRRIYLVDPARLKVRIFDAADGKELMDIQRDMPVHRFNPGWANIRLREVKAMYPERTYRTNYYEYFPVVRSFRVSPGDDLVFRLWTFAPHKGDAVIALRPNGELSPLDLSWTDWQRWCAVKGESALLILVDPRTEENSLIWKPVKDMPSWFAANPSPQE